MRSHLVLHERGPIVLPLSQSPTKACSILQLLRHVRTVDQELLGHTPTNDTPDASIVTQEGQFRRADLYLTLCLPPTPCPMCNVKLVCNVGECKLTFLRLLPHHRWQQSQKGARRRPLLPRTTGTRYEKPEPPRSQHLRFS